MSVVPEAGRVSIKGQDPLKQVDVAVVGLKEVDDAGTYVGKSITRDEFGGTLFSVDTSADQTDEYGVNAEYFSLQATIAGTATVKITNYVFRAAGTIYPTVNETVSVVPGDVKFNVEVSNWPFCSGQQDDACGGAQAAYLDLVIDMKGFNNTLATQTSDTKLSYASGVEVELSSKIRVDGTFQTLPTGFPSVSVHDDTQLLILRVPRFATGALYDPVITNVGSNPPPAPPPQSPSPAAPPSPPPSPAAPPSPPPATLTCASPLERYSITADANVTFNEGAALCGHTVVDGRQGMLAIVRSQVDFGFLSVQHLMHAQAATASWIGLSYNASSDKWTWVDGSDVRSETMALYGDQLHPTQGHCARVVFSTGKWLATPCDARLAVTCQLDCPLPPSPPSPPPNLPPSPTAKSTGDPHFTLGHGGHADFRGEHGAYWNLLSARHISLNAKTMNSTFRLRGATVHGTFFTEACSTLLVTEPSTGRLANLTLIHNTSEVVNPNHWGWRTLRGTYDGKPFVVYPKSHRTFGAGGVNVTMDLVTSVITTKEWFVNVSHMPVYNRIDGPKHRLDVRIKPRVEEALLSTGPHGLIAQSFDGDGETTHGKQDVYPLTGEFTTSAQAEGAIEGDYTMYRMRSPYAYDYRFSRFHSMHAPFRWAQYAAR